MQQPATLCSILFLLALFALNGNSSFAAQNQSVQPKPAKKLSPGSAWHNQDYTPPRHYLCYRAVGKMDIDGKLDDAAWRNAPWTESFVDIEGDKKPKPRLRTRVKMLWDDQYFYIAAKLEEPHVWATLTKHDSVIFKDNDFEVFIDPDGDSHKYLEYEINALSTDWDLYLPKGYKDGGKADNSWEIPGLKKAVHVQGTINNPGDTDKYWTVELAFPWQPLGKRGAVRVPPKDGEQWRVNFSRVQWQHEIVKGKYRKVKGRREDNWVWSPQGVINMHRPETWGYVQFTKAKPGTAKFRPDPTCQARFVLHRILYKQRAFRLKHKRWAKNLTELGLNNKPRPKAMSRPVIAWQDKTYTVSTRITLPDGRTKMLRLHSDARVELK